MQCFSNCTRFRLPLSPYLWFLLSSLPECIPATPFLIPGIEYKLIWNYFHIHYVEQPPQITKRHKINYLSLHVSHILKFILGVRSREVSQKQSKQFNFEFQTFPSPKVLTQLAMLLSLQYTPPFSTGSCLYFSLMQ